MRNLVAIAFASLIVVGAGCITRTETQIVPPPDSGIHLTASVGPTCPVERIPPDPNCADRPYGGSFVIETEGHAQVSQVTLGEGMTMDIPMEPGTYVIRLAGDAVMPSMAPQTFTVTAHAYTDLHLSLDSGIR